jgi:hypothetical protein
MDSLPEPEISLKLGRLYALFSRNQKCKVDFIEYDCTRIEYNGLDIMRAHLLSSARALSSHFYATDRDAPSGTTTKSTQGSDSEPQES